MVEFASRYDQDLLLDELTNTFFSEYDNFTKTQSFSPLIDAYIAGHKAIADVAVEEKHDTSIMFQGYNNTILPYLNANNPTVSDHVEAYKEELENEIEELTREHYTSENALKDKYASSTEFNTSSGQADLSRFAFTQSSLSEILDRAMSFEEATGKEVELSPEAQALMDIRHPIKAIIERAKQQNQDINNPLQEGIRTAIDEYATENGSTPIDPKSIRLTEPQP